MVLPSGAPFQLAACAKSEPGRRHCETDASHAPDVTAPDALMRVLRKIAE
jgi:hypothetical protein